MNLPDEKSDGNGMTATARSAADVCHQDETAVNASVAMPVETRPTSSESKPPVVTPTSTKRHQLAVVTVKKCRHCQRDMVVKRPSKRYCSATCRRAAWLVRNPEKAAELAAKDKARLRALLESRGIVWVEAV
jgi:hypothetical protein